MLDEAQQRQREERETQQISRVVSVMKTDDRVKHVTKAVAAEDRKVPAMTILREHNTCMICAKYHITSMVLPCAHLLFCRNCIEIWKAKANNCPQCRHEINMIVDPKGAVDFRCEYNNRNNTETGAREHREALSQELEELMAAEDAKKRLLHTEEEENVIDLTATTTGSVAPPSEKRFKKDE